MLIRKFFSDSSLSFIIYLISYILILIKFLQLDLTNNEFDDFFNSDAVFFNNVAKNIILENGRLGD